jgi:hypothetical protein
MNIIFLAFLACGEKAEDTSSIEDTAVVEADLELIGAYTDSWGGTLEVTSESISDGYGNVFHISSFDNDGDWLVAQNDAANEYYPELWSLFDWTMNGADLYYCQTVYDAASSEAAAGATHSDSSDLEAGCGGFAWTGLTAQ